jgi:predicted phage terminase large subunit-like protein
MLPTPIRMVVAVDPPATKGNEEMELDDLPEAGIICAFKGTDGHAYVIEDASLVGSPQEWGLQAVGCYKRHRADRMVAEVNQGGEMVEYVIRSIDSRVSFLSVHASKGKITRAEPIAALYEQGRVHHVGGFPQLEDQMTTYVPGNKSPDRMDALVWALTELMLDDDFSPNFKIVSDVQPSNWRV